MLERVYAVLDVIHTMKPKLINCEMPTLTPEEIEAFPDILAILKTSDDVTETLSGSTYASLSLIIPATKGLKRGINEISASTLSKIAKDFLNQLKIKAKRLERYEKNRPGR